MGVGFGDSFFFGFAQMGVYRSGVFHNLRKASPNHF